jgi:hypothetical protein
MLKRAVVTVLMTLGLVAALPGTASAAVVILADKNTYGSYDCQVSLSKNEQYVNQGCNVFDHECDDHGVYTAMKVRLSGFAEPGGWTRVTPNAGGCGHGKYFVKKKKFDSGIGTPHITHVYTILCVDQVGYDYCYHDTKQKHFFGW